ncbi:MAG: hypothetical protein EAZ90_27445 [Oscillatoriales cyanobacterium]|nr:MAG: hypothetical protein EAZ90_27445 [Oscillatoriales cyanobacterium]TAE62976.1 MAG: hypothetical protein EAZ86_29835 [Oscillatoriales cyanobacterium]TAG01729.1 MAG: hypothetical protein EAZ45_12730 [Oscillatoriales cyanobacterium]TAG67615.1 MAG: hypothetical protein EAZ25_06605 [Oscillatoriales cyanobacterium]TAG98787.1 MAG: hypothetical protein EAZ19_02395 [Oscillatoriales cyanobacterium]
MLWLRFILSSHKVFLSPRAEQLAFTSKCLRLFLNLELMKGNLLCDRPRALGNQARAEPYSLALRDRIPDCDKKCNIIAVQISRSDAFAFVSNSIFCQLNIRPKLAYSQEPSPGAKSESARGWLGGKI